MIDVSPFTIHHLTVQLQNLGKRYNRNWIFRHLNYTFHSGTAYAITGANGSGKSTLLQVLAGAVTLSEGQIHFKENKDPGTGDTAISQVTEPAYQQADQQPGIAAEYHHRYLSISAPYLELIEEMTLTEFFHFHFQFKPVLTGYTISSVIDFIQLQKAANRQIRYYSSGMKQRVKLAQAIFSQVPVVLLDEPLTNLDVQGTELYYQLIEKFCQKRLLIICSNSEPEIHFCKERLRIEEFAK